MKVLSPSLNSLLLFVLSSTSILFAVVDGQVPCADGSGVMVCAAEVCPDGFSNIGFANGAGLFPCVMGNSLSDLQISGDVWTGCGGTEFPICGAGSADADMPTDAPVMAPTDAPVTAPTDAPVMAPTDAEMPTDAPGSSAASHFTKMMSIYLSATMVAMTANMFIY